MLPISKNANVPEALQSLGNVTPIAYFYKNSAQTLAKKSFQTTLLFKSHSQLFG